MKRRRLAGALLAAAVLGAAVLAVAPAEASSGIFLYTDATTGLPIPLFAPPELSCIAAAGKGAYNFTGSDVILYSDGGCENYLLVLVPWETLNHAVQLDRLRPLRRPDAAAGPVVYGCVIDRTSRALSSSAAVSLPASTWPRSSTTSLIVRRSFSDCFAMDAASS